MRIKREDVLGIAVDYQVRLIPAISDNEEVCRKSAILICGLRELEIPILVSQQYTKGLGETVPEIAGALGEYTPFDKKSFSLWQDTKIREAIIASGRKTIVLFGTEAHICVLQTAVDLLENDYKVVYVEDCVGSRKPNDKRMAVKRAVFEGAIPATYESLLYELTVSAENEHFKAVSKLTK